jgi:hypothetical protein
VQYAPSFGHCIACGADYRPSEEEERAVLVDQAVAALVEGETLQDIKRRLVAESNLSELQSEEIAAAALGMYRTKMRHRGRQMSGTGFGVLLLGGVLTVFSGGFVGLKAGPLALGFALLVTGILMPWTGRNLAGRGWE